MRALLAALILAVGATAAADSLLDPGPIPQLDVDTVRVNGAIDETKLAAYVHDHGTKLLACYRTALARNHDLVDQVRLFMDISPKGVVSEATACGTSQVLTECVQKTTKSWRLPVGAHAERNRVLLDVSFSTMDSGAPALMGAGGMGGGFDPCEQSQRPSTMKTTELTVAGGLTKETVVASLAANERELLACYSDELRLDHSLAGTLDATFTILADGSVGKRETSTFSNDEVMRCVEFTLKRIAFAKPTGGNAEVTMKLTYAPSPDIRKPASYVSKKR